MTAYTAFLERDPPGPSDYGHVLRCGTCGRLVVAAGPRHDAGHSPLRLPDRPPHDWPAGYTPGWCSAPLVEVHRPEVLAALELGGLEAVDAITLAELPPWRRNA